MKTALVTGFIGNFRILAVTAALAIIMVTPSMQAGMTDDAAHPAVQVADQLGEAIASGDVDTLRFLLSPDVLIFEGGGEESSLSEYESHHMKSDIAFMSSMNREILSRRIMNDGDTVIVMTRSRINGRYKDKDMDLTSTETLVMEQSVDGWKIRHIHWSSK